MDILLVEDNEELGQLIYDFISNSGYSVKWVKSAEAALDEVVENSYKLLLFLKFDLGIDPCMLEFLPERNQIGLAQ